MAEEKTLLYAALLSNPEALFSPKIAEALARFQKVPLADVGAPARHSWGIVASGLPKPECEKLVDYLDETGLGGLAIPEKLLEDLPPAQALETLAPGARLLNLTPRRGAPLSVAWSQLSLLAAAAFKKTTRKTVKTSEGPASGEKAGKNKEAFKTREETDLVLYLDICAGGARFRVDAQNFDYAFLKAKMAYGVLSNFKSMAIALFERAPGAWKNRGMKIVFEGKPVNSMGYEDLDDLERETRWLLTLRALKPA